METRIDLERSGRHHVRIAGSRADGWRISLHRGDSDRRSRLHEAFKRHLVLLVDRTSHRFGDATDAAELPGSARRLDIALGLSDPFVLASLDLEAQAVPSGDPYVLSPFETRFLADNGHPHPAARSPLPGVGSLTTDLHTHFAGCVAADDLVTIGVEHGVRYPTGMLASAGIRVDSGSDIALGELPAELRVALAERLAISIERQTTFLEMERIYALRSPITKSLAAFAPLCRKIAQDYREAGVSYAELSLSTVLEAERLRILHRALPAIAAETGVELRFLVALSRHDDLEWDLDVIDRLRAVAGSRYVVGVDFMGHETCSTRAFVPQIHEVAAWADRARPGFVVRVHAGENPAYPENVRVALEVTRGFDVELRVGHGLYGVDDATLASLRDAQVIVEFNLDSNFALNNVQAAQDIPLRRYVDAGVPVVLGSDGYGIYQTSAELAARAGVLSGLDASHLAAIRAVEHGYVMRRRDRDRRVTPDPATFAVPDEAPGAHFGPNVVERKRAVAERRDRALSERLTALGVPVLDARGVDALLRGKRCVAFAGAWKHSWETVSPSRRADVERELGRLADLLEPAGTVFVTGGTAWGLRAWSPGRRSDGTCPSSPRWCARRPPSAIADTVSHAHLVGETLWDKAAGLYALLKRHGGLSVFVGGGNIVSDEIQTAANLRVPYLLMEGPEGASTLHARQQPERAFRTAEQVVAALAERAMWRAPNDPLFYVGPNPCVDIVLARRTGLTGALEILLVRRHDDAAAAGGAWAFPGGFVRSAGSRGAPWASGAETEVDACVRECREETGIDIADLGAALRVVGVYEGGGRDPRDCDTAWVRSTVFALELSGARALAPIGGADDACDAGWFAHELVPELAFDHARILANVLQILGA